MARPEKRRIEGSGRVTPKGGSTRTSATSADSESGARGSSGRYTPPAPKDVYLPSPPWVTGAMFFLLGAGMLMIILKYMEVLPGHESGWWIVGGLGVILGGIVTATQLR